MSDTGDVGTAMPSLRPHSKIPIPETFDPTDAEANGSVAPASETTTRQQDQVEKRAEEALSPAPAAAAAAAAPEVTAVPPKQKSPRCFEPISPGLSSISLPLGPSPKGVGGKDTSSVRHELVLWFDSC